MIRQSGKQLIFSDSVFVLDPSKVQQHVVVYLKRKSYQTEDDILILPTAEFC